MIEEILNKKSLGEGDIKFITANMNKFPESFLVKIGLKSSAVREPEPKVEVKAEVAPEPKVEVKKVSKKIKS